MTVDSCLMIGVLLLVAAAVSDLAARTLPNRLSVAVGLDGLVMQVASRTVPAALLASGIVFVLAIICWRYRVMGGGDVKLLAAVCLLVPPLAVPSLLLAISLAGGLLGVVYLAMPRMLRQPSTTRPRSMLGRIVRIEHYRVSRRFSLPYAVAISAGTLCVIARELAS